MWKTLFCTLLLAPFAAHAAEECKFQAPRNAALNLAGVRSIVIELGRHDLHLVGSATNAARVSGRACASSADKLGALQLAQHRDGDRLILTAASDPVTWNTFSFFGGSHYAYLDLRIEVPANLPVELDVGSGDADVTGVARLSGHTGSGDLHVRGISTRFDTRVGSGDVVATDVGEIHVESIGSGEFTVDRAHGNVQIGSIGSGDATLRTVDGSVDVGSIGSGDLRVDDVAHDLHVRSVGSGDVEHKGVLGRVDIPKDD